MKLNRRDFLKGAVAATVVAAVPKVLLDDGWICCADEFPPNDAIVDIKFYHPKEWGTGMVDHHKALKTVNLVDDEVVWPGFKTTLQGWLDPGKGLLVLQPDCTYWRPAQAPKLVLSKATQGSYIARDGYIRFV